VALGNAPTTAEIVKALNDKLANSDSKLINEHIEWALEQHHKQIPIINERLNLRLIKAIEKGLPRDA